MKKLLSTVLLSMTILLGGQTVFAQESQLLGKFTLSDSKIINDAKTEELYLTCQTNYIETSGKKVDVSKNYTIGDYLQVGNVLSHTLTNGDNQLVPLRVLAAAGELDLYQKPFLFKKSTKNPLILMDKLTLKNASSKNLLVEGDSYIAIDGKVKIQTFSEELLPDESKNMDTSKGVLLGRIIKRLTDMESNEIILDTNNTYGINNTELAFKINNPINLNDIFPEFKNYGTLKYDVNGFKKGETVEIYNAESRKSYKVYDKNKNKVTIPWNSISVNPEPGANKKKATNEQIESFANMTDLKSDTNYLIWTDLDRQETYVLKKDTINLNWKLEKRMLCSTGKLITPTPSGTYKFTKKVSAFGMNKGYMCKNASGFIGTTYLYHSVMFDKTGSYVLKNKGTLGERASMGCIRLSPEDAKWVYDTLPVGTTVLIR